MRILIVYAHHEKQSFNGALCTLSQNALKEMGHEVLLSDLYQMKFTAEASADDFSGSTRSDYFKYQDEQLRAYEQGRLCKEIVEEQEKLRWCDLLILHFPLWWFSMPAVMKGWVDRVFTPGFVYGGGKWYNHGGLRGKKAMLTLTTGAPTKAFSEHGIHGDIHHLLLPIHRGILSFSGFEVLPPYIVFGAARISQEERIKHLGLYRNRLSRLEKLKALPFFKVEDFNDELQLKSELRRKLQP